MSSYIIAGSADSIDTAYCQQIARRIQSKYKNIDFRIVIKHASQWQEYLQQICRIYGFLKKSNPIVYTFDGKIIGNRENFIKTATQYFGLDQQSLIVENLTAKINMKLAQEEVKQKRIVKNNIRTLNQKIQGKLKQLLQKKRLKYNLKNVDQYLVNGIQYRHRSLQGLCQTMRFTKNRQVPIIQQQITPQQINLMTLSLQDQIKLQQPSSKQAFVTNANANLQKQKHPSQIDRMSQASKTNKLHQSMISGDKQSKGMKQSNKTKLRIDQQNDDVTDYIDYPMAQTVVCQLGDMFFVAFDTGSLIGEELIFYHNQDGKENVRREYNNSRPIKGHRVLVKEVHYQNQNLLAETQNQAGEKIEMIENQNKTIQNENKTIQVDNKNGQNENNGVQSQKKEQEPSSQKKEQQPSRVQIQKSKTQPNIPVQQKQPKPLQPQIDDANSQPTSDLNLISHMTYHTLFIHKPLSPLQLKNLLFFIRQTNTIATLRFLPQNPNPRVRCFIRRHLIGQDDGLMPVQRFIVKQKEDGEVGQVEVPSQKGSVVVEEERYKLVVVNQMGFEHYLFGLDGVDEQKLVKVIKYTIDHILAIQEQVKRDIGYNLIFTKTMMMVVPLVQPYEVYNGNKLYFDGLAYLGYVHTAKLNRPYTIGQPKVGNQERGRELTRLLGVSTGYSDKS